jgi:hypothetical protein
LTFPKKANFDAFYPFPTQGVIIMKRSILLLTAVSLLSATSSFAQSSRSNEIWHDHYTNTVTATGVSKTYENHDGDIPGGVIASRMGSEKDAMALWGRQGAKSVKYTGCGECGVGSKITVVVDFGYIIDTHVYERTDKPYRK